ncbi:MAG: isocitrate dehydrogenase (NADP(+)) [Candidatus Eisenbacteria bacterium]|uniref:Isocitrate dehydrogenase [NADP] n=1 Tax=Eiseniibacteriota bacterium TaxID=2212470 RepID=A0A956NIJ2_UNCEI|nr:isocitrate dehydrogenase (NADP(+)) [Candidatus Eisenbacteria bacterium]
MEEVPVSFEKIRIPEEGQLIQPHGDGLKVPDQVILPFIEGDGTGRDIWKASVRVFDAAVSKAYGGDRKVVWWEIFAGEKSLEVYGENVWLPNDTLEAIKTAYVAIKGPLTTPVGGGIRSINVALRQILDLYACVRPVSWVPGVPSPVKEPGKLDVVIFRENTEDVYAGIEWEQGTPEVAKLIEFLGSMGKEIRKDSGVGIKPISVTGSERLVRKALQHAVQLKRKSVTLVHKGNIQKFTEGAFNRWGYDMAAREFGDHIVTEADLWSKFDGKVPEGRILVKDRIADAMFQQLLLRPDEYDVIATTNLNGDYLSDACAAQVGGLGLAPGSNIGDHIGVFEATHGTAPKYADQDKINPGSVMLSGAMMFDYLGWTEAADLIRKGIANTVAKKQVTYDLERLMDGATLLRTSEFASAIIENL